MSDEQILNPVTVELLGKERPLRYTFGADIKLKRLLGGAHSITKGWEASDPEQFVKVLWAGLISDSKELDKTIKSDGTPSAELQKILDNLADSIEISQYEKLIGKVMDALSVFKKKDDESEPKGDSSEPDTEKKS
jgi:hypothetical protein